MVGLDAAGDGDQRRRAGQPLQRRGGRRGARARKGSGALVVLNDEIHYARNVMKTDTTSVQTFKSLNRGPAGVVHTGKIEWFEPMDQKLGNATEFSIDKLDKLPRVDIIYAHANMSADLIDAAVKNGAKGIVDRRRRRRQHDEAGARRARQGGQGGRRRRAQHAPAVGHRAAQQRGQRRRDGLRRLGRAESRRSRACCCSSR